MNENNNMKKGEKCKKGEKNKTKFRIINRSKSNKYF